MGFNLILFYVFAAIAVGTTLLVVVQSNPVYSVLLLIGSFIGLAGLYVLLEAPFVAVIQIIVYAGAIMVLFLFVVMLLNAPREAIVRSSMLESGATRAVGGLLALAFAAELAWALTRSRTLAMSRAGDDAALFRAADRSAHFPGVRVRVRGDVDPDPCGDGGRDYGCRQAPSEKRPGP